MIAVAAVLLAQATAMPIVQAPITVTGRRGSQGTTAIVRQLVSGARDPQITRFEDAVCPAVIGTEPAIATAMVAIVRANIMATGTRPARTGCRVNALVVFAEDPRSFVRDIRRAWPTMTRGIDRRRKAWLIDGNAAVRSWQLIEAQSSDGIPLSRLPNNRGLGTRLVQSMRQNTYFAFAVLDSTRIKDRTVRQLADIVTLHLLLNVTPGAATAGSPSILALFETDASFAAMTPLDRGMLKGLYRQYNNNQTPESQRQRMATEVRREEDAIDVTAQDR